MCTAGVSVIRITFRKLFLSAEVRRVVYLPTLNERLFVGGDTLLVTGRQP